MSEPVRLDAIVRLQRAFERVGTLALGVAPVVILGAMTLLALRAHVLAGDAAKSYVPAARSLLAGSSPYRLADVTRGFAFASPPVAGFLFSPFTVVPHTAAAIGMAGLMLGITLWSLWLVGLRDWRCFAIAAVSAPLVEEFQTANLSAVLVLCAAVVWKYRSRARVAGVAAGMAVAVKLVPWPLIVFFLLTRRFRAAAWAAGTAAAAILIPWAAVGFAGLGSYPGLLLSLDRFEGARGYSLAALVAHLSGWEAAQVVSYVVGGLLLLAALRMKGDGRRFIACVAATLLLSPVVWVHYFIFSLLALAVRRPAFSAIWALPLLLWASARPSPTYAWQALFALCIVGALFLAAYRGERPLPRERQQLALAG